MNTIRAGNAVQPAASRPLERLAWMASALVMLAGSAGCANTTLKSDKLQLARQSEVHAANMGANEFAPVEMQAARDRLGYAQTALDSGDLAWANALSDEALVDTRLAEAKVQAVKAEKAASELAQSRRALQSEIQNNLKP